MRQRQQLLFAVIVWAVAEIVLQAHGICFWSEHGGWQGWIWSVAIGVVAVWLWLHDNAWLRWLLGTLASLLLLLGPLWQVGSPLVAAMEQRATQQQGATLRVALLRNAETEQAETLRTYLRNSETRQGWADEIAAVRADLAATRAELSSLSSAPPAARVAWLSLAVIVLQLAALVTLQIAAVAALNVIRRERGALLGAGIPFANVGYRSARARIEEALQRPGIAQAMAQAVARNVAEQPEQHETQRETPKETQRATQRETQRRSSSAEWSAAVRARIVAGHYGATPSVRGVMAAESLRYRAVGPIFKELLAAGVLQAEGRGYRLATE